MSQSILSSGSKPGNVGPPPSRGTAPLVGAGTRADVWPTTAIRIFSVVLPGLFLAGVLMQPVADPKLMFLDALAAAEYADFCCRPYYGFVSTVGIMLWVATAAVCLFAALAFALARRARPIVLFAAAAGLLSGWLALDDAFLLHEVVLPHFGIPQNVALGADAGLAVLYVFVSLRVIWTVDKWLLLLGCGSLAASMGVDVVFHSLDPVFVYVEDSAKFFGIFCWASFHVTTMARLFLEPSPIERVGTSAPAGAPGRA